LKEFATMTVPFKPTGYTSVAPYLLVDGAEAAMTFLEHVFDARRLRCIAGPDGRYLHAELCIDDTVVMLADVPSADMAPSHLHVYVSDVDATYAKAVAAGAKPVRPPEKGEDPDKRGGFRDPSGTTWWVGTQVERHPGG
jgi:PhnB protein